MHAPSKGLSFKSVTCTGLGAGPRLIITGAVHGNETCGTRAIRRVIEEGIADFVALGRAFLNDPRWVWRAALTLGEPISSPRQYLAARHTAISPMEVSLPPGTMATTSTQPLAANAIAPSANASSDRLLKGMVQ